jgi:hypothetical protein
MDVIKMLSLTYRCIRSECWTMEANTDRLVTELKFVGQVENDTWIDHKRNGDILKELKKYSL